MALEELIQAPCEFPAYSTLDRPAGRILVEVNGEIFERVHARMRKASRVHGLVLLERDLVSRRSGIARLKQTAPATLSKTGVSALTGSARCNSLRPPARRPARSRRGGRRAERRDRPILPTAPGGIDGLASRQDRLASSGAAGLRHPARRQGMVERGGVRRAAAARGESARPPAPGSEPPACQAGTLPCFLPPCWEGRGEGFSVELTAEAVAVGAKGIPSQPSPTKPREGGR